MSIFKETFADYVKKQLEQRENIIASGAGKKTNISGSVSFNFNESRSDKFLSYQQKQCTVRLSSGVNIIDKGLLDEGLDGAQIAERWVLEGGIKDGNTNRGGIGAGGAYGDEALRSNADDGYGIVPMPGITGVNIRTKSAYGSLREAKVNFVCHNRRQLEVLELLYMRPGYTLLLEWQWSPFVDNEGEMDYTTIKKIPFFDSSQTTAKMEGQIQEFQEETGGNYDALVGYCKNFTYKLRADGGFDCETELIAKGDIIESLTDKETSIMFRDGESAQYSSRPNIELFLSQMIALNNAVEGIEGATSGNVNFLSRELAPKIGLTEDANVFPYILTGGSKAYTTFSPDLTFWDVKIDFQDSDQKEEGAWYDPLGVYAKNFRTSTTWVRWDAFCHFLNKEVIPLDENEKPLCEFTTAYITSPDKDSKVKMKPLLYSSKYNSTKHITSKIPELQGFEFIKRSQSFQSTSKKRKIQFKGLCDISTNNQICMLPHNLKAYDYLNQNEQEQGSKVNKQLTKRRLALKDETPDMIKEGILKKQFFKPLINSLKDKNTFKYAEDIATSVNFFSTSGDYYKETPTLFDINRTWSEEDSESIHNIGGIYIGVEYLYKKFREGYYDSEGNINKDFALFKFIKEVWEDVNAACVGNHDFDIQTDNTPGGKLLRIIDRQVDNSGEKIENIYTLKIQSLDSVVQDITYNTTIPSSLSSTIAIAAQAPDSVDDLDKVSFAALNKGIQDRFSVLKNESSGPELDQIKKWKLTHESHLVNIYDALHVIPEGEARITEVGGGGSLRELLYRFYQESRNYILKEDSSGIDVESTSEYKGAVKNVRKALNFFLTHYGSTNKEEGYWTGQPATDSHSPLSAIIPLKFNAKLDGISGIKIGSVFKLPKDRLPLAYNGDDIHFIVMGEEQNIDNNQNWITTISGHLVLLGDVNSEEYKKSKHYKSWQEPNIYISQQVYNNAPELGDLAILNSDDYEPGSKTFAPWPNSELVDPLRTMVITSPFGPRTIGGVKKSHKGIDLRYHPADEYGLNDYAKVGGLLPFYAVGDGMVVIKMDPTNKDGSGTQGSCGGTITLTLDRDPINLTPNFAKTSPYKIIYCHVQESWNAIYPKAAETNYSTGGDRPDSGYRVRKGEPIGFVGGGADDPGSGNSSTRHLHMAYETKNGTRVNPARWMPGIGGKNTTKEGMRGYGNLLDKGSVHGEMAVDNNNQIIIRPINPKWNSKQDNNKTYFANKIVKTITPSLGKRQEAMLDPNKEDEKTWYLVKDGYFKQYGVANNLSIYVRIHKAEVGAFVLDDFSNMYYDPTWFTGGIAGIFDIKTYQGGIPIPYYDKTNFEGNTMNFPHHMHYSAAGNQIPPNKLATLLYETEVQFGNAIGDSDNSTAQIKI